MNAFSAAQAVGTAFGGIFTLNDDTPHLSKYVVGISFVVINLFLCSPRGVGQRWWLTEQTAAKMREMYYTCNHCVCGHNLVVGDPWLKHWWALVFKVTQLVLMMNTVLLACIQIADAESSDETWGAITMLSVLWTNPVSAYAFFFPCIHFMFCRLNRRNAYRGNARRRNSNQQTSESDAPVEIDHNIEMREMIADLKMQANTMENGKIQTNPLTEVVTQQ